MAKKRPPLMKFSDAIPAALANPTPNEGSAAEAVRKMMKAGGLQRASMVEVAEAMVNAFGGAQGIAARARIEYEYAAKGSPQRARILQLLLGLLEYIKGSEPIMSTDGMTDEEIEREILSIVAGAAQPDAGSPNTPEGRRLLEEALLGQTSLEQQALDAEIEALKGNHEIDKLAADELQKAHNASMHESGIYSGIIPDADEIVYDDEEA